MPVVMALGHGRHHPGDFVQNRNGNWQHAAAPALRQRGRAERVGVFFSLSVSAVGAPVDQRNVTVQP